MTQRPGGLYGCSPEVVVNRLNVSFHSYNRESAQVWQRLFLSGLPQNSLKQILKTSRRPQHLPQKSGMSKSARLLRPQFLSDILVLEPGCKNPLIFDTQGNLVKTLSAKGEFSYAGVSQNGKRFALQVASFSGMHSLTHERFVIHSTETWEPVTEVTPDEPAEEQSWTTFSPDGSMFVADSPLKLTLYRLP